MEELLVIRPRNNRHMPSNDGEILSDLWESPDFGLVIK
jgi:hypothetical protein